MVNKKAVLVGCNYPGTNAALNGCVNDVHGIADMLKMHFGFAGNDMTIMIDTDKSTLQPTGKNIKAELAKMVSGAVDGDILFFHFSGHGTQIPSNNDDEDDGKDEAICPTDMNVIADDDLRIILSPLSKQPKTKFTMVADCCHSGTMLDHDEVQITGPKEGGPAPPAVNAQAIQDMLASLGAKRDFKNRSLPANDLMGMLSDLLGQPVEKGGLRSSMSQAFGADASAKSTDYVKYAKMAMDMLNKNGAAGGASGGGGPMDMIMKLLKGCMGGGGAPAASGGGGGDPAAAGKPQAGKKPANLLDPDVGILITGCQDKETSADACPSGDPSQAYGALSNALQVVVKSHFESNPGAPPSYRNLVLAVRKTLAETKFAQNPCLECSDKHADSAFILH
eukprot:gene29616-2534_t